MSNTDLHSYTLISSIATVYTCWCWYWQRSIQLCLSIFNAISTTFYAISAGIDPLSQPKNPVEFDNIDWILAEIDPLQSPPQKKILLNLTISIEFDLTSAQINPFSLPQNPVEFNDIVSNSMRYWQRFIHLILPQILSNLMRYRQRLIPFSLPPNPSEFDNINPIRPDISPPQNPFSFDDIDRIRRDIGKDCSPQSY